MPTQQQLDNRLNPTPVNVNLPGNGAIFRSNNPDDFNIYQYNNGSLNQLDLGNLGRSTYGQNIDALGGSYNFRNGAQQAGIDALKSKYGIDFNSITTSNQNMADLLQHVGSNRGALDPSQLSSLLKTPNPNSTSETINGPGSVDPSSIVPEGVTPLAPGAAPAQQTPNLGANGQSNTTTGTPQGVPLAPGQTQAPTNTPASTPQSTKTNVTPPQVALQPGNTGDNVKALQDYLVSQGLMTQEQVNTGYGTYGPQTTAAVAALQQKLGVDNSTGVGYFGPKTLSAIESQSSQNTSANPSGITTQPSTNNTVDNNISSPQDNSDPVQKQVAMYQEAYSALGLPSIKNQYDTTVQQQADLTNKMNQEILDTQNNPWLSQGIIDKTSQKIKDKYSVQLDTLTHLETLYDSMYKQGQAQVETLVSKANADIAATNSLAQKQLDAATALAKDNVVQSIGGRELLINKTTGKTVADLGPSTKSVSSTTNVSMNDDVQNAASQLQQIVQTKNFKGVDPTDYKTMAAYLQDQYGTKGVAALKTALNALGLKVDTGLNANGTPEVY